MTLRTELLVQDHSQMVKPPLPSVFAQHQEEDWREKKKAVTNVLSFLTFKDEISLL